MKNADQHALSVRAHVHNLYRDVFACARTYVVYTTLSARITRHPPPTHTSKEIVSTGQGPRAVDHVLSGFIGFRGGKNSEKRIEPTCTAARMGIKFQHSSAKSDRKTI